MRLSTRTRYGLRAMIDLALHTLEGASSAEEIGRRTGISEKYLQNILYSLKGEKLVNTVRGPNGGYVLARASDTISVGDIVTFLEGDVALVKCLCAPKSCVRSKACAAQEVWEEIHQSVKAILHSKTLSDLAGRQHTLQESKATYEI